MKKHFLLAFLVVAFLFLPFLGCHHHHGGGSVSPPSQNPAAYTYTATEVAHHQPGFFSCANWNGRIMLGTYQDYHNRMHCQLCELVGNKVNVIHTFEGESVYHVRAFPGYLILPIEQGGLFRYDAGGVHQLRAKTYHMGFYDFTWLGGHNYALEKANINPPNKVAVYRDLHDWFFSTGWKAKDAATLNGKLYFSASGLNGHTECAILDLDPATKAVKLYKTYRFAWPGTLAVYDNAVWMTMDNGVITNTRGEEYHVGDHGWFIGKIGDTLFATTGARWRQSGNGHVFVFDPVRKQFVKVLDLPGICEPWSMCAGPAGNQYYLVTRNEHKDNLGRVYLIERK